MTKSHNEPEAPLGPSASDSQPGALPPHHAMQPLAWPPAWNSVTAGKSLHLSSLQPCCLTESVCPPRSQGSAHHRTGQPHPRSESSCGLPSLGCHTRSEQLPVPCSPRCPAGWGLGPGQRQGAEAQAAPGRSPADDIPHWRLPRPSRRHRHCPRSHHAGPPGDPGSGLDPPPASVLWRGLSWHQGDPWVQPPGCPSFHEVMGGLGTVPPTTYFSLSMKWGDWRNPSWGI